MLFENLCPQILFADQKTPLICGATWATMTLYQTFQNTMLGLLEKGNLWEQRINMQIYGLWPFSQKLITLNTGKTLTYSGTLLQWIVNEAWWQISEIFNLTVSIQAILALVAVSFVGETFSLFQLLMQQEPIVRDWRTLLQIESRIFDIAYNLAKQRVKITADLDNQSIDQVENILKAYANKDFITYKRTGNGSYISILKWLIQMNAAMKRFLWYPVSKRNADSKSRLDATFDLWCFEIEFTETTKRNIDEEYREVRFWFECDENIKKMGKKIGTARKNEVVAGSQSFGQQIKESNKKLWAVLKGTFKKKEKKEDPRFTEYELTLLRTMYGIDVTKMTENEKNRWKEHFDTENSILSFKTMITNIKNDFTDTSQTEKKEKRERSKEEKQKILARINKADRKARYKQERKRIHDEYKNFKTQENPIQSFYYTGENTFSRCLQELQDWTTSRICNNFANDSQKMDFLVSLDQVKEMMIADREETNRKFSIPEIQYEINKIYVAIEEINLLKENIGKKWDTNSLVQLLGTVCEKQCSNKWTKWCRATKEILTSKITY